MTATQKMAELDAMACGGMIAVNQFRVNLDDLVHTGLWNGRIVRVDGDPRDHIMRIPAARTEADGCIAGWISEDE